MRKLGVIVFALVMAACGSGSSDAVEMSGATAGSVSAVEETSTPGSSVPASSGSTSTTTLSPGATAAASSTTAVEPSEDDLAAFVAALEEILVGTVYEDEAINEPELFLATGWLFCDWLDDSDTPDAALTRYLDELAGGVDAATDDQLVLAGALLGAAVGVLCPQHAAGIG